MMTLIYILAAIVIWPVISVLLINARFNNIVLRLWCEPVFRQPVLIIESDDWGAGPLVQRGYLQSIIDLLSRYQDETGHPPVMTLGIVLAIPDKDKIRQSGLRQYFTKSLDDDGMASINKVILAGTEAGVFALQLHGTEHFHPLVLMKALSWNERLNEWLQQDGEAITENLPAELQSRWIDASSLPSTELSEEVVEQSIQDEASLFHRVFAMQSVVAVPNTFIWNDHVEKYWHQVGITTIVTCGKRYLARDKHGKPVPDKTKDRILNGEQAAAGCTYVVRDDYFEPELGHEPAQVMQAIRQKIMTARPALLETHRSNFLRKPELSLQKLEELLNMVVRGVPAIRFLSTQELAEAIRNNRPEFIQTDPLKCLPVFLYRLISEVQIQRWLKLTGLLLLLKMLIAIVPGKAMQYE